MLWDEIGQWQWVFAIEFYKIGAGGIGDDETVAKMPQCFDMGLQQLWYCDTGADQANKLMILWKTYKMMLHKAKQAKVF